MSTSPDEINRRVPAAYTRTSARRIVVGEREIERVVAVEVRGRAVAFVENVGRLQRSGDGPLFGSVRMRDDDGRSFP